MSESTINILITAIAGILTALITAIASIITKIQEKRFELEKLKLENELKISRNSRDKYNHKQDNNQQANIRYPEKINTKDIFSQINWIPTIAITLLTAAGTVAIMTFLSSLRSPSLNLLTLETIQFDYADSPTNHGWNIFEGDTTKITFEKISDSTVGNALKISTPSDNFYAMDYDLSPKVKEFGNFIDVVSKFDYDQNSFYTYISMTNASGKTQNGWLKFKIGKDKPLPYQKSTGEPEWLFYVNPVIFPNSDWVKMRIDLIKAVQETYGIDGWTYNKLLKFRIRGNLSIDSVTIFKND